MDTSKLRPGEIIAAVSGAALLIVMFFSWFSVGTVNGIEIGGVLGDTSLTAWQAYSYTDLILFVAGAVAIALAVVTAVAQKPDLPISSSVLTAGLGGLAFLLVVYRGLINPPGEGLDREVGVFLGLIASAGIAYGGWRSMQDETPST